TAVTTVCRVVDEAVQKDDVAKLPTPQPPSGRKGGFGLVGPGQLKKPFDPGLTQVRALQYTRADGFDCRIGAHIHALLIAISPTTCLPCLLRGAARPAESPASRGARHQRPNLGPVGRSSPLAKPFSRCPSPTCRAFPCCARSPPTRFAPPRGSSCRAGAGL